MMKTALVVDDIAYTRLLYGKALKKLGFAIEEAENGMTAVRKALARPCDLILLDLNLPDMTGIDILEKIKANPHTKRSPVVVLTTTDDAREIQRCYDLGANVYITKPVNYEGFSHAIRQLGLFFSVMQVPENS